MIAGKTIDEWVKQIPILASVIQCREVMWTQMPEEEKLLSLPLGKEDLDEARQRWQRFASYLAKAFPETKKDRGRIESPLRPIEQMHERLRQSVGHPLPGQLFLKCDSHLPIAGSVKARGGIYEVLQYAEKLALDNGWLTMDDDYQLFDQEKIRSRLRSYTIVVGSTGNLGLSIGIIGSQLGFRVIVHMSKDAKQWKKEVLRKKGAIVVEHESDYSQAVAEGRKQAESDPNSYFVDDENSTALFLGYAASAFHLQKQLAKWHVKVDEEHPLFVYLPCGVGGAPGGIAFGLKHVFGEHVHCFFAEPTHAPAMLLGMITRLHDRIAVQDVGIDPQTEADGLAVGRASRLVGKLMEKLISGIYTVQDEELFIRLWQLHDAEGIALEPSAAAGLSGIIRLYQSVAGQQYIAKQKIMQKMNQATHLVWATGGSLVPEEVMNQYLQKGLALTSKSERSSRNL